MLIFENFIEDISLVVNVRVEHNFSDRVLEKYISENVIEVIKFLEHFIMITSPANYNDDTKIGFS